MHTPVLLKDVVEGLNIKVGGLYIDATAGEGGHLFEILKLGGRALGIDVDHKQIENLKKKLDPPAGGWKVERPKLVVGNYADIEYIAKANEFFPVDGIVLDFGLSMGQLRESGRGLSYKKLDEELDMRLSDDLESKASDLVNSLSKEDLYEIFARFSEELNSRAIAEAIVRSRSLKEINKVGDLTEVLDKAVKRKDEKVYSRIFQALRIAVNNEFGNMKKGLVGAHKLLKKGGLIAVITFHSLEDRIVKRFMKDNHLELLNNQVIFGDKNLPYERSAKLRIIVKGDEKFN